MHEALTNRLHSPSGTMSAIACSTIACHGHDAIPGQAVFLPCRHLSPTREICDNIGNPADDVRAHESSRNFLDGRSRVYRIPTDWPGPANFQQPLNYGRIPWSANRISPTIMFTLREERRRRPALIAHSIAEILPDWGISPENRGSGPKLKH